MRAQRQPTPTSLPLEPAFHLIVEDAPVGTADRCCTASLCVVQRALLEAHAKQALPVDYLDVTQGFLAKWKRWIKRKLLGNFKHAYVDVLSRQQSAFNRQTLTALQELAECCAVLDHALVLRDSGKGRERGERATESLPDVSSRAAAIDGCLAAGKGDEIAGLLHQLVQQLAQTQQRLAILERRLARTGRVQS
jgi:hypothetical protein